MPMIVLRATKRACRYMPELIRHLLLNCTMEADMKKRIKWIVTTLVIFFFAFVALAGTRDECIAKCKEAVQYYQKQGLEATIEEIGNKDGQFVWNNGTNYVFMMNMDAVAMAHPFKPDIAKRGSLLNLPDANGKLFRQDFIDAAKKGKGWTKYVYELPGSKELKPKYTYICRIPDTNYFVGAGFYVIKAGVYR